MTITARLPTLVAAMILLSADTAADTPDHWHQLKEINNGVATFQVYDRQATVEIRLDNLVLSQNLDLATFPFLREPGDLRGQLLRQGLACLQDVRRASVEEIELQRRAATCGNPGGAPNSSSGSNGTSASDDGTRANTRSEDDNAPPQPGLIERIFNSIWANWDKLVGVGLILLIGLAIRGAYKAWRQALAKKAVDLIIAGVPSAGKTALYLRLVDPDIDISKIDALEASSSASKTRSDSVPSGPFTYFPRLKDLPGAFTGMIIDEFVRRRSFVGFSQAKCVLVVVLAPVGFRKEPITSASSEYMTQQESWSIIIKAVTQAETLKKPDLIAIFLNKCDLYSQGAPFDKLTEQIRAEFRPIVDGICAAAKEAGIETLVAVGSARMGLNTGDFLAKITRALNKSKR